MPPDPVIAKVAAALHGCGHATEGIVAAVSGGPDSVALLRALLACSAEQGPARIVVAHLNHCLRGPESDADEAFVRELVPTLRGISACQLEVCTERVDVRGVSAEAGANLEDTARRVRYAWFVQVARDRGLHSIATGHTADDQAETVLHRLLRGTGLQGLRGIARRREVEAGIHLLRPLLHVTRREVLAFLQATGQPFREDVSNNDLRLTRNRLRHRLLPLLAAEYNPAIPAVLCRLAGQADELFGFVEQQARQLLAQSERPQAGSWIILDRSTLDGASRYLVREALRCLWKRERWSESAMDAAAWHRLDRLVQGQLPRLDLPGGIVAHLAERVVRIGPAP